MADFYRKERLEKFKLYIEKVEEEYKLKTGLIYQAKNTINSKRFAVFPMIRGSKVKKTVVCKVSFPDNNLIITVPPSLKEYKILESQCSAILAGKNTSSIKYLALNQICKDHATSSRSSPLISGCTSIEGLNQGSIYPGYKLKLELNTRIPFENPHSSGLEAEHFLIGKVNGSDCSAITYIGLINKAKEDIARNVGVTIV